MSPTLIPLLIAALLLAGTDGNADTVEVVMTGRHQVVESSGALIVGEAQVTIPQGAELAGPVYVIGGELVVDGVVASDVVQLAGTVVVTSRGTIAEELRHIGGTESLAVGARVGRRTSLDLDQAGGGPAGYLPLAVLALLLGLGGAWLETRRRPLLGNVASTVRGHPVIATTVGALMAMTGIAVTVFMAFTLVLLPLAIITMVIGLLTAAYGLIAWGHILGSHLPIPRRPGPSTAAGVIGVLIILRLVGLVPLVGDVVALGVALAGAGAAVISYYGLVCFRPVSLPPAPRGEV